MTPAALAALHARVFTTPRPWSAAEFAALMGGPGVYVLGDPLGFVMGRAIAGEAEVLTLAVAPEARRQGVARGLMARFENNALEKHAETAFLEVAEDNSAAIHLYLSLGYTEAGRRRGYFAPPQDPRQGPRRDAIVMTKALVKTG
ncbi:N-acetyltransferase [Pseudorhodobacter sp.]|uniref:GNAT family N-acetyltransferase n=1 Tax=Pseudorhodobacter sp. TaxID=1934400 RepID=UPI002AFFA066|nr:N-acetyltransferase [Pseudorhodobacter sp.]